MIIDISISAKIINRVVCERFDFGIKDNFSKSKREFERFDFTLFELLI